MRGVFVLIHRWAGLFIAVFLFIAGATGAVISWDHEVDEWLNPELYETESRGPFLSPVELARRVEADDVRRRVTYFETRFEQGHATPYWVAGRRDSLTGRQIELDHNQVFIDPVTGKIVGTRNWGAMGIDRQHLMSFLYVLHYSLHIPAIWGIENVGVWLMGIVGIVWLFDSFVGFYLTLPALRGRLSATKPTDMTREGSFDEPPAGRPRSWWQRWKPAWLVKWSGSRYRINFDLHRALGLWFWLLLIIIAFTAISMNLGDEVVRPIVKSVSTLSETAWDKREERSPHDPIEPGIGYDDAIALAEREARRLGWTETVGAVFYAAQFGIYSVGFLAPGESSHGAAGMVRQVLLDGNNGSVLGEEVPWAGTAGDIFLQLQFPIHSGRIFGTPGRVAISIFGVVVAILSATGIVIWLKKRAGRQYAAQQRALAAGLPMPVPVGARLMGPVAAAARLAASRALQAGGALVARSPAGRRLQRQLAIHLPAARAALEAAQRGAARQGQLTRLLLNERFRVARAVYSPKARSLYARGRRYALSQLQRAILSSLDRLREGAHALDGLAGRLRTRWGLGAEPGE